MVNDGIIEGQTPQAFSNANGGVINSFIKIWCTTQIYNK